MRQQRGEGEESEQRMKDEGRRNIHGGIERVTPDEMKREGEAEIGEGGQRKRRRCGRRDEK